MPRLSGICSLYRNETGLSASWFHCEFFGPNIIRKEVILRGLREWMKVYKWEGEVALQTLKIHKFKCLELRILVLF